jgi:predicted ATPase
MKVVITGGSFAGKTTIVDLFSMYNHPVVPESGQAVTDDLVRKMGIKSMNTFRQNKPYQFLDMVARKQRELEKAVDTRKTRPLFLDRSMHDYVAYLRVIGVTPPRHILAMLTDSYDHVFLMDTLTGYRTRSGTGRTLDREFSIRWRDACRDVYQEFGMDPVPVKEMPVHDRLELIRKAIQS